jgi:hypothetical protein
MATPPDSDDEQQDRHDGRNRDLLDVHAAVTASLSGG